MSFAAQYSAGLVLVFSFGLLCAGRVQSGIALVGAQYLALTVAALAERRWETAAIELVCAAMLPIAARERSGARRDFSVVRSGADAGVAWLALSLPGGGVGLAVALLGALAVALSRETVWQVLGLATLQNGDVLLGISLPLSPVTRVLVALPLAPALATWWLGRHQPWARLAPPTAWEHGPWVDVAGCTTILVLACLLPWYASDRWQALRPDAFSDHAVMLTALVAAAGSWHRRGIARRVPGSRFVTLSGAALALLAEPPLLAWLALLVGVVGAVAADLPDGGRASRTLRLGSMALGLALFGAAATNSGLIALPARICLLIGIGGVAPLAPELTIAAVALILRDHVVPDLLLQAAGLAALVLAGMALTLRPARRDRLVLAGIGYGGLAVFAEGLGTAEARFAAILVLTFLALAQSAALLSGDKGVNRLAAWAGLGGLPPFGPFPAIALVIAATAQKATWILLPLFAGLALLCWPLLARLPRPHGLLPVWSLAWLPLALIAMLSFAMPDPVLAWLRTVAAAAR